MQINKPAVQVLSSNQIKTIHEASIHILEKTGIVLKSEHAVELLCGHGATLNERGRVCIPAHLVEKSLELAPKSIPMYDQNGELAMDLRSGQLYFGTGSDTIYTIDPFTGERRHPTTDDVQRIASLCDTLPNISFVMSMGTTWDVPSVDNYIQGFIGMVRGTTKPIVFTASNLLDMEHIWKIACAVAGGVEQLRQKPFLMNYSEPISPLLFPKDSVEKLLFCAQKGIPAAFVPSPNMGGGGPVTLAGALALANAEILAGMVMAQLTHPGAYCLYGANIAALDMRSAVVSYGAPEWSLSMSALSDMARFYGLPCWGCCGATDAKTVDAQAGLEAYQSVMNSFLAQTALNHDIGYIESGLTSSMEMILLVDEIISMVLHAMQDIDICAETLALDVIDQVQPGSGFLAEKHTVNHMRKALYFPKRLNRERFENWQGMDMYKRLNLDVIKILNDLEPRSISDDIEEAISAVLAERG